MSALMQTIYAIAMTVGMAQDEPQTLPKIQVEETADDNSTYAAKRGSVGTKTDTPLVEVPQSISVITFEQIRDQNAQNMQEVLRYSAGIRAEMYGLDNRGDWFTLRGGSEGSTLLDGLRLPLSGWYGNVRNEPFAFERVEVLRGPSSVIAGQNGPGGVVNLVSKRPQIDARREITGQLGNFDHRQVGLDFTGPLNADSTLLYRLVSLARDAGTQVNSADEERQYFAPSFTWLPGEATSFNIYGQYQRDESNNNVGFWPWEGMLLPTPGGQIPVDTFVGEPDWDSYGGRRVRFGYQLAHQLNDNWSLRHNVRYEDINGHLFGMYADFGSGLINGEVNRIWYGSRTDTHITNADIQAEGHLTLGGIQHTLLVAVEALRSTDGTASTGGSATPLNVYNPVYGTFPLPPFELEPAVPSRVRQFGVVVQDQLKLADQWVLVGSLRRDSAKNEVEGAPSQSIDDSAWSKRMGVVYLAPRGVAPYLSYSESFETVAGANSQGAAFKPKRGKQVEAGLKWSPDDQGFMASAALYKLKETNRLTYDQFSPNLQVQRGEVTVKGLELDATAALTNWDVVANYTFTDAQVSASDDPLDPQLNRQLSSIPAHAASAWAVRRFDLRGLSGFRAGAGVRYVGETWDGRDMIRTPSNTLLDAMASFEQGNWLYSLNASNLTDKVYLATCLDRGDCWYGNRRKIAASVRYLW